MELYYPAEDEREYITGQGYAQSADTSRIYVLEAHLTASSETDLFLRIVARREDNFSFSIYQRGELSRTSLRRSTLSIANVSRPTPDLSWNFVWEAPYYPNGKAGTTVTFGPADSYRE